MSRQIHAERNETAIPERSDRYVAQPKARLVAGIAINALGAIVLFSESLRFINAGL